MDLNVFWLCAHKTEHSHALLGNSQTCHSYTWFTWGDIVALRLQQERVLILPHYVLLPCQQTSKQTIGEHRVIRQGEMKTGTQGAESDMGLFTFYSFRILDNKTIEWALIGFY